MVGEGDAVIDHERRPLWRKPPPVKILQILPSGACQSNREESTLGVKLLDREIYRR